QSEGRARHIECLVAREVPDQRARERGLAGAEIARERDEIAGFQDRCDIGGEPCGRPLVREHDRETGSGRDCEHSKLSFFAHDRYRTTGAHPRSPWRTCFWGSSALPPPPPPAARAGPGKCR